MKAVFVNKFDEPPPFTHRLVFLMEKAELSVTPEQLELLEIVNDFNLEARYPDEKFSFFRKCTAQFTQNYLTKIEDLRKWLLLQIQY